MAESIKRHLPRFSELARMLRPRPLNLNVVERRLARSVCVADLRQAARKRVPRPVFDYVDGGADEEILLRRQYDAWDRVEFRPHVLRNVSSIDMSTTVLGRRIAMPLVMAPTGFNRLVHTEGERAVVRAARR